MGKIFGTEPGSAQDKVTRNFARKAAEKASIDAYRGSGINSADIDKEVDTNKEKVHSRYSVLRKVLGKDALVDEESKEVSDLEKGRKLGHKLVKGEEIREKYSIPRKIKHALEKD